MSEILTDKNMAWLEEEEKRREGRGKREGRRVEGERGEGRGRGGEHRTEVSKLRKKLQLYSFRSEPLRPEKPGKAFPILRQFYQHMSSNISAWCSRKHKRKK